MTTAFATWNRKHPSEMGIDELTDILDTLNAMHEDASDMMTLLRPAPLRLRSKRSLTCELRAIGAVTTTDTEITAPPDADAATEPETASKMKGN
jgi:hypothetical protein